MRNGRSASTQIFGGRRYETLPMQECKRTTTEEQKMGKIEMFCKCRIQEGVRMVSCTGWKFGEKTQSVSGIVTTVEYNSV